MSAPENPEAFPCVGYGPADDCHLQQGMTLRDWFAGQALAGILAGRSSVYTKQGPDIARKAFEHADAMLTARQAKGSDQ